MEMLQNIQKSPPFEKMQKDCQVEGIEIPKTLMAKDPVTHVLTPQEYLQNVEAGTMPPMNNHQMMKEMAENVTVNDQTNQTSFATSNVRHCPKLHNHKNASN